MVKSIKRIGSMFIGAGFFYGAKQLLIAIPALAPLYYVLVIGLLIFVVSKLGKKAI